MTALKRDSDWGSLDESDPNPYLSVDPAPSGGAEEVGGVADEEPHAMGERLRDKSRTLFERYRWGPTLSRRLVECPTYPCVLWSISVAE